MGSCILSKRWREWSVSLLGCFTPGESADHLVPNAGNKPKKKKVKLAIPAKAVKA
jgi:hypothetical protein